MEMNFEENLIDRNVLWDITNDPATADKSKCEPSLWTYGNGTGIRCDCNEKVIIAYNLFGRMAEHAVSLNIYQNQRPMEGRTGLCHSNKVIGNLFYDCPRRIYLARCMENEINWNVYDAKDDASSFLLCFPEPYTTQNLRGWQAFLGFDLDSCQQGMDVSFDSNTCRIEISLMAPQGVPHQSDVCQDILSMLFSLDEAACDGTFTVRQNMRAGISQPKLDGSVEP